MANVPIGDDLMEVIGPRGEGLVFNGLTTYADLSDEKMVQKA